MEIDPRLLQFGGSLAAILLLAWLALALRLGGKPQLLSEDEVRRAANEVADGFAADEIVIDQEGSAALLRDSAGQIMLLKPHGSNFAGRVLTARASAAHDGSKITINSGETRFGSVTLTLEAPDIWAEAINRLRDGQDD